MGVFLLSGCSSTRQLEAIDSQLRQVRAQLTDLETQVSSKEEVQVLEERLADETGRVLRSEADLQLDVRRLADRISELESQLQDTLYRLDQLSQQMAATNQDLRTLLSAVPSGGEGSPTAAPITDPQALYEEAYSDYREGNYDLAILGFEEYLRTYPDTDLADNALYWIGECHFNQDRFTEAIEKFSGVLADYPRSDRLASAMLRRAYAHLELGQREEGVSQLRRLVRDYPSSDEAAIAREQLDQL